MLILHSQAVDVGGKQLQILKMLGLELRLQVKQRLLGRHSLINVLKLALELQNSVLKVLHLLFMTTFDSADQPWVHLRSSLIPGFEALTQALDLKFQLVEHLLWIQILLVKSGGGTIQAEGLPQLGELIGSVFRGVEFFAKVYKVTDSKHNEVLVIKSLDLSLQLLKLHPIVGDSLLELHWVWAFHFLRERS